jgi:hypothetical protein
MEKEKKYIIFDFLKDPSKFKNYFLNWKKFKYNLEENVDKFSIISKFKFMDNKFIIKNIKLENGKVIKDKNLTYDESLLTLDHLNLLKFFLSKPTIENYKNFIEDCDDKNLIYFFLNLSNSNKIVQQFINNKDLSKATSDILIQEAIKAYKAKDSFFIEQASKLKLKDIEFLELLETSILSLESCAFLNQYLEKAKNALDESEIVYDHIKAYQYLENESPLTNLKKELLHRLYVSDIQIIQMSCEQIKNLIRLHNNY